LPVLAGAGLFLLVTHGELTFDNNSVFYWSAANTLIRDGRLATGIAYEPYEGSALSASLAQGRVAGLHPMAAYAPGYAVAIAAVAWCSGLRVDSAALLVNVASLIAIIFLVGWLTRQAAGPAAALLAMTMTGSLPFFSGIARVASSEAQFTALVLAALVCVVLWLEKPDERAGYLYAAGFFGVLATYTRYLGISFFVFLAVLTAYRFVAARGSRANLHASAALIMYVALVVPLAMHNLRVSGHLSGAVRPASDVGAIPNLVDLVRAIFEALPLLRNVVVGPLDLLASAALLVGVTLGAFDRRAELNRLPLLWWSAVSTRVAAMFVLIYCAILVVLRSYTAFEIIHVRYLFPAMVAALVPAVTAGRLAIRSAFRTAVAILWVGMAAITTCVGRSFDPGPFSVNSPGVQGQSAIRSVQALIKAAPDVRYVILSDDIYAAHFATARPAYGIPPLPLLRGTLAQIRAVAPDIDVVFVIGPPSPRASLDRTEGNAYGQLLDEIAVRVSRMENQGVWHIPPQGQTPGRSEFAR
jgi:4-amino-4-deoxy-L-arabinose transferase-like glycosyltransferase